MTVTEARLLSEADRGPSCQLKVVICGYMRLIHNANFLHKLRRLSRVDVVWDKLLVKLLVLNLNGLCWLRRVVRGVLAVGALEPMGRQVNVVELVGDCLELLARGSIACGAVLIVRARVVLTVLRS